MRALRSARQSDLEELGIPKGHALYIIRALKKFESGMASYLGDDTSKVETRTPSFRDKQHSTPYGGFNIAFVSLYL